MALLEIFYYSPQSSNKCWSEKLEQRPKRSWKIFLVYTIGKPEEVVHFSAPHFGHSNSVYLLVKWQWELSQGLLQPALRIWMRLGRMCFRCWPCLLYTFFFSHGIVLPLLGGFWIIQVRNTASLSWVIQKRWFGQCQLMRNVFSQVIFDDSKTIERISSTTGVSECGPWTPQVNISWVVAKNRSTFRSLSQVLNQDFCCSLESMFLTISLDESHVQ